MKTYRQKLPNYKIEQNNLKFVYAISECQLIELSKYRRAYNCITVCPPFYDPQHKLLYVALILGYNFDVPTLDGICTSECAIMVLFGFSSLEKKLLSNVIEQNKR